MSLFTSLPILLSGTVLFSQSFLKCLTTTETIKTPNQDRGRLCRNTTELFIISTAWTQSVQRLPPCILCACGTYECRKHSAGLVCLFLAFFNRPPFSLPPSPSFCFPASLLLCFCLEVEPIVLDSLLHRWKSSSACDAERAKKHRNMACLQQRWFREEGSAAFCMQAGLA